jgi:hypothetical protein
LPGIAMHGMAKARREPDQRYPHAHRTLKVFDEDAAMKIW